MIEATAIGLGLAIGSALCWSGLDISRKSLGERISASGAVAGLTLFQVPILLAMMSIGEAVSGGDGGFGRVILGGFPDVSTVYWGWALGSVVLNVLANFLFLRAVQISALSLTIPYLAFTPVFTAFSALIVLGEEPNVWGWAGISAVCTGAFFLNPGEPEDGPLAPLKALWTERGSLYMLLVALLWSVAPVLDKKAMGETSVLWHTMIIAAGIAAFFLVGRTLRDRSPMPILRELGVTPLILAVAVILNVGAMVLQLAAYDYTGVAYVETIKRAIGVIAAIVAGYLMFGERDISRRLVGAAVMVIGVALIVLAE